MSLHERLPIPTPARLKEDLRLPRPPFWMVAALCLLIAVSFVPLALVVRERYAKKSQPRVQIFQDMGAQPRYNTQGPSPLFTDGRAMRPPVPGTVAREDDVTQDDHYTRGFAMTVDAQGAPVVRYFAGLPRQITLDTRTMQRGQQLFNVYCYVCHGYDGAGNGPVNQRALDRQEPKWVPPSNLIAADPATGKLQYGSDNYPDGKLYNTIRNGIRNMPAYGPQIDTADRWAIVAYVRALQRAQHTTIDDVPAEQRDTLH